jgi:hypothetical protein
MDWKSIQATEHVQAALSEHTGLIHNQPNSCAGYNNLWCLPGNAGELCVSVGLHTTAVLWHCPLSSKHPIYWPMDWKVGGWFYVKFSFITMDSLFWAFFKDTVCSKECCDLAWGTTVSVLSVTAQIFSEVEHHFNISRVVNGADNESNLDTFIAVPGKEKTFHRNAVQKYYGTSAVSRNSLIRRYAR